jgi:hypothetical protein
MSMTLKKARSDLIAFVAVAVGIGIILVAANGLAMTP